MNITTENIEEWCFRYLEKDLNASERTFFEKELQSNAALKKEYALWEKTIVKTPELIQPNFNITSSLFRYKIQFISLLAEFALVSVLVFSLLHFHHSENKSTKDQYTPLIKEQHSDNTPFSTIDLVGTEKQHLKNESHTIGKPLKASDSLTTAQPIKNEELLISNETTKADEIISNPQTVVEPITTVADTSVASKTNKEKTKKKSSGYRKGGSRLIPINNDL